MPAEFEVALHGSASAPSSSNSSAVCPPEAAPPSSVNELLALDAVWNQSSAAAPSTGSAHTPPAHKSPAETDSEREDAQGAQSAGPTYIPPQLSHWLGRPKLGQW